MFSIVANRVSVVFQARAALGKISKPTITNHLPTVKHTEKRKLGAKWKWIFFFHGCPRAHQRTLGMVATY